MAHPVALEQVGGESLLHLLRRVGLGVLEDLSPAADFDERLVGLGQHSSLRACSVTRGMRPKRACVVLL